MKIRTIALAAVGVVVLLIAGVAVFLLTLDVNQYKGRIAEAVKDATGRELTLKGDIKLVLGFTPSLAVNDVSFANAPWGSRPQMATIKKFEAEVALIPLLSGHAEVKRLILNGADILIETDARGRSNLDFAETAAEKPKTQPPAQQGAAKQATIPIVNVVQIEDAVVTMLDGKTKSRTTVKVEKLALGADSATSPLKLDLAGAYNNQPIKLRGTLGPLASLSSGTSPWPIDLTAEAGGATVKAKGSVKKPMEGEGVALDVSAEGSSLASLGPLAGSDLPPIGPYKLKAHIAGSEAKYDITNLELTAGKTTLTGDASVIPGKKPMEARANLSSKLIDLADFSPPAKKTEAKTSAPASGQGKAGPSDGRVLSDAPLPLDALKDVNADVKLRADKLQSDQLALSDLAVDVTARNGALTVRPFTAVLSGGKLNGDVSVSSAQVAVKFTGNALDLGALLKTMAGVDLLKGAGDIALNVTGSGKSVRAIAASLNGTTELVIGQGEIDSRYVDLIGADVLRTVAPWLKGQSNTKLNCMVSRFDIRNGVATVKDMLMDTQLMTLTGKGNIDLRNEHLDLQLIPQPKDSALVSLALPINVGGTLASPSAMPDPMGVAKRAGGMLGGAALGPLGVLGGLASGGTQDKNPCVAALQKQPAAGQRQQPAAQPAQPSTPLQGIERGIRGIFNR